MSLRVGLIGDSNVGKTSIVHCFLDGKMQENQTPTIGAVFHSINYNIKGKTMVFQIWDTAGQECFKALGPLYYRNCKAAIAVFDLTKKDSMASIDEWIKEFRDNSEGNYVIIVGNKSDLYAEIQYTFEETCEFASKYDAQCIWTSAKSNLGINEVFDTVFEYIASNEAVDENYSIIEPKEKENKKNNNCC